MYFSQGKSGLVARKAKHKHKSPLANLPYSLPKGMKAKEALKLTKFPFVFFHLL